MNLDAFHELEIHDPEMLDFNRPEFAIGALYKLITLASEHMATTYPTQEHMVFVRLPIEV